MPDDPVTPAAEPAHPDEPPAVEVTGTVGAPDQPATAEIIELIDRLEELLDRSDLAELEVQAGDLGILLRKPWTALAPSGGGPEGSPAVANAPHMSGSRDGAAVDEAQVEPARRTHVIVAPLTGVWYTTPSPDAPPYVRVGSEVLTGQIVGLIEAMKLFNEIKSDASGRVVRIVAAHGELVKARQPLVELEPS